MNKLFPLILILTLVSFQVKARIINVPDDQPAIQLAITEAAVGDTILIAPGTYYENLLWSTKNITIGSHFLTTGDTSYISQTIIDGGQQGRVFYINNVGGQLIGLMLTHGKALEGAGLYIKDSKIGLENIRIVDNHAVGDQVSKGAGIIAYNSKIFVDDFVIASNSAVCVNRNSEGGAIYSRNSELFLNQGEISDNSADIGGGILQISGSSDIKGVHFTHNTGIYPGGALAYFSNAKLDVINSSFSGNTGMGSVVYADDTHTLSFRNCLFTGNSDYLMIVKNLMLRLINCTFTANTGKGVVNCLYSCNFHAMNSLFFNGFEPELNFYGESNLAYIGYCGMTNGEEGIAGNVNLEIFGPVRDNDPLFMDDGSYKLSAYSSYIGAGMDSMDVFPYFKAPVFDYENNSRPMPAGSMPDVGAYEHELGSPLVNVIENPAAGLNIYPNPVRDFLFIDWEPNQKIKTIRVFSMEGKMLIEKKPRQHVSRIMLEKSNFHSKGLLIVEVVSDKHTYRRKILTL